MEVARLEAIYTANDSEMRQVSARVEANFKHIAAEALKVENRIKQAFAKSHLYADTSQALTVVDQRVRDLSRSMTSLQGVAVGVLAGLSLSTFVSELQQAATAVLRFKSNLESSQIAFTTMLGSADLANQHLKDLQQFALTTPFEFEGLVDASKRMQAMGFEARQIIPILTDVGNAVAAVGGRRDTLDRVVLALSQIQAKGKVAAQEMNQLAEAGIPAWRLLAETLGVSRAEAIKLAEEGKISGAVFLEAFQKFSQANFGGMMERQSRTFAGAMSNIKDTLLQTAGTAFDPLFKNISQITDRMAQELSTGKPTLDRAFQTLMGGLIEMAGSAGGQIADTLIAKITDPRKWAIAQEDPFFIDRFLKGLFRGLPDPLDLFGIGDPSGDITKALQLPDLRSPLPDLTRQQKQNSEEARKAAQIYDDLALKLAFYGQTTEVAATKQRLLAIGMEALVSVEGRRAIQLAELIDKQRISAALSESQKKLTDDLAGIAQGKYKNAFDVLLQTSQDARLEMLELSKAEAGGLSALERFNFGLGAQIGGLISLGQASGLSAEQIRLLRDALVVARTAMAGLTDAQNDAKLKAEIKRIGEQRADLLRSLAAIDVGLGRQLRGTPADEIQRLAEQLEGLSFLKISPGGLDRFVERVRSGSADAQTAIAEIGTAINNAAGDIGAELPQVTGRIANLFLKAQQLTELFERDEATARYRDVLASLHDVIQGDVQLTSAQRIEKLLLSDAYRNLTEAQMESLRATAQEADIAERLRADREERMQTMREVAEDVGFLFADVFDSIQGNWSDMWRDMARIARNISRQLMQEVFTVLASRAFNVPFTSQAGGIVGLITNSLFNRGGTGTGSSGGLGAGLGGLLAGQRALGGPVDAGRLYQIHDHEYFIPNIGGRVATLDQYEQMERNQPQQPTGLMRVGIFDDMRTMNEWRPDRVLRNSKYLRKVGKLVPI